MTAGADASSVVTSAQMRAMNLGFVGRYFSQYPSKNLTRGEVVDLGQNGFNLFSIYEDDVNDWARDVNGGVDNARRYLSQAQALGVPLSRPCYFAVDTNVDPNEPRLHGYFRGVNEVLGTARVGVYGSTGVLRSLKAANLVDFTFRTMSIGWNGGAGNANEFSIVQSGYINQAFDRDASSTSQDFGQWRFNWTPNSPSPEDTVHLWIAVMCANEDPKRPAGQTTNAANVVPIQDALVSEGFLRKNTYSVGHYGSETVSAYAGWQGKCGYRGRDADGIPGMTTLAKLGSAHGFHVVA